MNPYSPLPNFWSLLDGYHPCPTPPTSGMPLESPQLRPERDFRGTPYNHTWVPLKSIVEHFRALLRDFCFVANFFDFSLAMKTENRYIAFSGRHFKTTHKSSAFFPSAVLPSVSRIGWSMLQKVRAFAHYHVQWFWASFYRRSTLLEDL